MFNCTGTIYYASATNYLYKQEKKKKIGEKIKKLMNFILSTSLQKH